MFFSLSTNIEEKPLVTIEFKNPRWPGSINSSQIIEAKLLFPELKYATYATDGDTYPTIAAFLAKARFYVALDNQHSDRNPTQDKSLCVQISFGDGAMGKSVQIEAFIQKEILTSALLLSKQSSQVDFHVGIDDETILKNLETKLDPSKDSDYSIAEILDTFTIKFL